MTSTLKPNAAPKAGSGPRDWDTPDLISIETLYGPIYIYIFIYLFIYLHIYIYQYISICVYIGALYNNYILFFGGVLQCTPRPYSNY